LKRGAMPHKAGAGKFISILILKTNFLYNDPMNVARDFSRAGDHAIFIQFEHANSEAPELS
jgi:hypothetical protein